MAKEAACRGRRFQFLLRLEAHERLGAPDEDGDWITGAVEIQVAGRDAVGPFAVAAWAPEIVAFRDELEQLDRTLTGRATLGHLEGQFGLQISMKAGRGSMSGFVREVDGMTLRFEDVELDQSFVRQTLREFTALVSRGRPPRLITTGQRRTHCGLQARRPIPICDNGPALALR